MVRIVEERERGGAPEDRDDGAADHRGARYPENPTCHVRVLGAERPGHLGLPDNPDQAHGNEVNDPHPTVTRVGDGIEAPRTFVPFNREDDIIPTELRMGQDEVGAEEKSEREQDELREVGQYDGDHAAHQRVEDHDDEHGNHHVVH